MSEMNDLFVGPIPAGIHSADYLFAHAREAHCRKRSARRVLFGILIALAIGIALGYWLFGDSVSSSARSVAIRHVTVPSGLPQRTVPVTRSPRTTTTTTTTTTAAPTSTSTTTTTTTTTTAPVPPTSATTATDATAYDCAGSTIVDPRARDLFLRMNRQRAQSGLQKLCWDPVQQSNAVAWSRTLVGSCGPSRTLAHSSFVSGAVDKRYNALYENVGCLPPLVNPGPLPASSGLEHLALLNSAVHRAAMLGPNPTVVSIGVFCAADGSMWVTEMFGRRWSDGPVVNKGSNGSPPVPATIVDPDPSSVRCP